MALRTKPLPFRPGEMLVEFTRAVSIETNGGPEAIAFAAGERAWVSSRSAVGGTIWLIEGDGKSARWVGWTYDQQLPWYEIASD